MNWIIILTTMTISFSGYGGAPEISAKTTQIGPFESKIACDAALNSQQGTYPVEGIPNNVGETPIVRITGDCVKRSEKAK